jgi:hypothetical protein
MSQLIIGLDLGQVSDFSALAVLESTLRTTDSKHHHAVSHYACRALKRWPLGTAYSRVVAEVAAFMEEPPLAAAALVMDATGVGRPTFDMLRREVLPARLVPVTITAGRQPCFRDGFHHVPKSVLIATVQRLLRQRRIKVAPALRQTPALLRELRNLIVKLTPSLHETFGARTGERDDLVLALALAAWYGEQAALHLGRHLRSRSRFP